MKTKIDELTLKCIYAVNGCTFFGKVNSIDKHEKTCEFRQLFCQNKNCSKISSQGEIKHAKDCDLYLINCQNCNKLMKQIEVI